MHMVSVLVFASWTLLAWLVVCVYHLSVTLVDGALLATSATLICGVSTFALAGLTAGLIFVGAGSVPRGMARACMYGSLYAVIAALTVALITAPYVLIGWGWITGATVAVFVVIILIILVVGYSAGPSKSGGAGKTLHTE
ncbi:MAG: hypothetical protein WC732_08790 [Candidatus Omnitrophota bacterium]